MSYDDYLNREVVFTHDGRRRVGKVTGIITDPAIVITDQAGDKHPFVIGSNVFKELTFIDAPR